MTVGSRGASFRGRALLLSVLGAVVLIVVGVAAYRSRPASSVGSAEAVALASAPAGRPASSGPPAGPASGKVTGPASGKASGKASGEASREVGPARLRIPRLQLDATVAAVGVDAKTGDFAVPPSVDRVGWYKFGPGMTTAEGSIVVAGHVDSAAEGKGAFFKLRTLSPGDPVTLSGPDGEDREFSVVAREVFRKTRIPLDRYFARDGAPRLTLITCGGPFDAKSGHYRDNIVVTAEPLR